MVLVCADHAVPFFLPVIRTGARPKDVGAGRGVRPGRPEVRKGDDV